MPAPAEAAEVQGHRTGCGIGGRIRMGGGKVGKRAAWHVASRHTLGLPANCVPFVPNPSRASTFSESQPAPTCSVGSRGAPCTNHLGWPLDDNTSCIPKNTPSLATCLCHCPTLVPYPVEPTPSNRFGEPRLRDVWVFWHDDTHPGNQARPPTSRRSTCQWNGLGFTTTTHHHQQEHFPPYRCFCPASAGHPLALENRGLRRTIRCPGCPGNREQ